MLWLFKTGCSRGKRCYYNLRKRHAKRRTGKRKNIQEQRAASIKGNRGEKGATVLETVFQTLQMVPHRPGSSVNTH